MRSVAIFFLMAMENELRTLSELAEALKRCCSDVERTALLDSTPRVIQWQSSSNALRKFCADLPVTCQLIVKSLVALGQEEHLINDHLNMPLCEEKLRDMLDDLLPVETFYREIGGIVGYHATMASFLLSSLKGLSEGTQENYHRPPGIDISLENAEVRSYLLEGIACLPHLAEVYPVGGAADRLKLCDLDSGMPLPAAKLEFCGYTLLERLIRDVQGREYLYYKLFGQQIVLPIAMMTSSEKDNHRHIVELCESKRWFGRHRGTFRLFCQPAVPTMDRSGKWCLSGPFKLLMKPGGHGVIWKVARDEGVFEWLKSLGCHKILVRQINNPIAGIDYGLLAFSGVGFRDDKLFGFASCPRQVGSAEGINVLIEKKLIPHDLYCLTNIEYCDFSKFSIEDVAVEPGSCYSKFPSNTNILFADIAAIEEMAVRCPIPGMLVNLKTITFTDETGGLKEQEVARLESTMQNIADCFEHFVDPDVANRDFNLKTFLTYHLRNKTISTTKKLFQGGDSLLETPEGCFYDLLSNAHDLLTNYCHMQVPKFPDINAFILSGPPFLFFYHPALGPLFSIIAQKIRGGHLSLHSELHLEVAEADVDNLQLSGSLIIRAENGLGNEDDDGVLRYSDASGYVRLHNVVVDNCGVGSAIPLSAWRGEKGIERQELCEIVLLGDGEFIAENVALRGNMRIVVEPGCRVIAFLDGEKVKLRTEALSEKSKRWSYSVERDQSIALSCWKCELS